jgi:hypothetical protein
MSDPISFCVGDPLTLFATDTQPLFKISSCEFCWAVLLNLKITSVFAGSLCVWKFGCIIGVS